MAPERATQGEDGFRETRERFEHRHVPQALQGQIFTLADALASEGDRNAFADALNNFTEWNVPAHAVRDVLRDVLPQLWSDGERTALLNNLTGPRLIGITRAESRWEAARAVEILKRRKIKEFNAGELLRGFVGFNYGHLHQLTAEERERLSHVERTVKAYNEFLPDPNQFFFYIHNLHRLPENAEVYGPAVGRAVQAAGYLFSGLPGYGQDRFFRHGIPAVLNAPNHSGPLTEAEIDEQTKRAKSHLTMLGNGTLAARVVAENFGRLPAADKHAAHLLPMRKAATMTEDKTTTGLWVAVGKGARQGAIVRVLPKAGFDAWKKAIQIGVPTEPILQKNGRDRAYTFKDAKGRRMVRVWTRYCGPNLTETTPLHAPPISEWEAPLREIQTTLDAHGIDHGHIHFGNLTKGPDGVMRLIDWDRARILSKRERDVKR